MAPDNDDVIAVLFDELDTLVDMVIVAGAAICDIADTLERYDRRDSGTVVAGIGHPVFSGGLALRKVVDNYGPSVRPGDRPRRQR